MVEVGILMGGIFFDCGWGKLMVVYRILVLYGVVFLEDCFFV